MALLDSLKGLAKGVLGKVDMDEVKDLISDAGELIEAVKTKDFSSIIEKVKDLKDGSPDSDEAMDLVGTVKSFLSDKVGKDDADNALSSVAKLATSNDDVKDIINKVGGSGASDFVSNAIKSFLKK